MAKCNTLDSKWKSELPNATIKDDGELSINKESSSDGSFDGKHEKTTKPLFGKCREKEDQSIWFVVPENKHLYFGVFINNKRIRGVRFDLDAIRGVKKAPLSGDDEWVATKT